MRKSIARYGKWGLSVLVSIVMFLFWYVWYPHALSYQEQYQLFLWTGDYFLEKISLSGGFADWVGEFIVQFYYVEWLGALLLALLFVALQRLTLRLMYSLTSYLLPLTSILSLLPVALDDRTCGMVICHHKGDPDRMEALVVDWLVSGGAVDGVCVAIAAVAVAADDDGTELLSDPIAVSSVERL